LLFRKGEIGMVAPRSTKLYQNFLIHKGVLFWVISSPTPSPTLYRRLGKTSLSLCLQTTLNNFQANI